MTTSEVRFTFHAQKRMEEMGLSREQVQNALFYPDIDTCSKGSTSNDEGFGRRALSGDIAVAYFWDGDARIVVTVLPRTYEKYQRNGASK